MHAHTETHMWKELKKNNKRLAQGNIDICLSRYALCFITQDEIFHNLHSLPKKGVRLNRGAII